MTHTSNLFTCLYLYTYYVQNCCMQCTKCVWSFGRWWLILSILDDQLDRGLFADEFFKLIKEASWWLIRPKCYLHLLCTLSFLLLSMYVLYYVWYVWYVRYLYGWSTSSGARSHGFHPNTKTTWPGALFQGFATCWRRCAGVCALYSAYLKESACSCEHLNLNHSGRVKGHGRGEFFLYSRSVRNFARAENARELLLNSRLSFKRCIMEQSVTQKWWLDLGVYYLV